MATDLKLKLAIKDFGQLVVRKDKASSEVYRAWLDLEDLLSVELERADKAEKALADREQPRYRIKGTIENIRFRRERGTTPRAEDVDFLLAALVAAEERADKAEKALREIASDEHAVEADSRWAAWHRHCQIARAVLSAGEGT